MKRVKLYISGFFFYFINTYLARVPSHTLRNMVYIRVLGRLARSSTILMGVKLRKPSNIFIDEHSIINSEVLLDGRGGKLTVGKNVDIAQETNIWTLEHNPHSNKHADSGGDVVIEDYVWIASRCTILPGVTIGKGAVVAANSVVTKDVEELSIVGGIPARKIGNRESELGYTLKYRPPFR